MADPLFDLTGRIAVIVGAASGLAQAIALGFAERGVDLLVADINDVGLNDTVRQVEALGRRAVPVHCDVSDVEQVNALFQRLDQEFEHVDILVNAPYTFTRVTPETLTLEQWNQAIAVCLTGYFLCAQAAGRRMIAQGSGGNIINIGSIAGQTSLGRGNFVYGVAKSGIHQMTRELATEWAKYRIRVNAILPAQMKTQAMKAWLENPATDPHLLEWLLSGIPMNRLGETADIVGPAVFLASDAAAFVTGVLLPVDGGNLGLNGGGNHTW
jgi:NAD(P)-dependent dehydrogenase (short-subunit alcohol dehydrogenase family)